MQKKMKMISIFPLYVLFLVLVLAQPSPTHSIADQFWRLLPRFGNFFAAQPCRAPTHPFRFSSQDNPLTIESGQSGRPRIREKLSFADDSLQLGFCRSPTQCKTVGGLAHGSCAFGLGVCCVNMAQCDRSTRLQDVYLGNQGYPDSLKRPTLCTLRVERISASVRSVRISFVHFELASPDPTSGCVLDAFWLENVQSPLDGKRLCGQASGQHLYVRFRNDSNSFSLKLATSGSAFERKWLLRIEQLEQAKTSEIGHQNELPPLECDQYFDATHPHSNAMLKPFSGLAIVGQTTVSYQVCVHQEINMCRLLLVPHQTHSSIQYSRSNDANDDQDHLIHSLLTANKTLQALTDALINEQQTLENDCTGHSAILIHHPQLSRPLAYCDRQLKNNILLRTRPFSIRFVYSGSQAFESFDYQMFQLPCSI